MNLQRFSSNNGRWICVVILCMWILGCSSSSLLPEVGVSSIPEQTVIPAGREIVPCEVIKSLPLVEVYINGQGPYRFVLDTGSTCLMVSRKLVGIMDPPPEMVPLLASIRTPEGDYSVGYSRHVETVKLGNIEFHGLDALVVDTEDVFQSCGKVDGVLGITVFADCQLTIDYLGNQLILKVLDKTEPLSVKDENVLPLKRLLYDRFAVPVKIGQKTLWCMLDSGHEGGIVVPEEITATLPLDGAPVRVAGSTATFYGKLPEYEARLKNSAFLGPYELIQPNILVQGKTALIGADVLKHFVVTIDQRTRVARFVCPTSD